jgi:hypothetical protein
MKAKTQPLPKATSLMFSLIALGIRQAKVICFAAQLQHIRIGVRHILPLLLELC